MYLLNLNEERERIECVHISRREPSQSRVSEERGVFDRNFSLSAALSCFNGGDVSVVMMRMKERTIRGELNCFLPSHCAIHLAFVFHFVFEINASYVTGQHVCTLHEFVKNESQQQKEEAKKKERERGMERKRNRQRRTTERGRRGRIHRWNGDEEEEGRYNEQLLHSELNDVSRVTYEHLMVDFVVFLFLF